MQITVTQSHTPITVNIPFCFVGGRTFRRMFKAKASAAEMVDSRSTVSKFFLLETRKTRPNLALEDD